MNDEMKQRIEMKKKLLAFQNAAIELTELWEQLPLKQQDDLADEYPFDESFDDVVANIRQWVERHV